MKDKFLEYKTSNFSNYYLTRWPSSSFHCRSQLKNMNTVKTCSYTHIFFSGMIGGSLADTGLRSWLYCRFPGRIRSDSTAHMPGVPDIATYWVTQKLPEIYAANHATFPIRIRKITVPICGNFWVTQYNRKFVRV